MTSAAPRNMTAADFLAWAMVQPEGARYELVAGEAVAIVIHHARDEAGTIATTILGGGRLRLDPPGIDLDLDRVFARR